MGSCASTPPLLSDRGVLRIIGMTSDASSSQTKAVAAMLMTAEAVSWDGDPVKTGSFTAGAASFVAAHCNTASAVLPATTPGSDGTYTQSGDLAIGCVPKAKAVSQAVFERIRRVLRRG